MNRKENIRSAYRLTGSSSFFDGTTTSPGTTGRIFPS